ncbi:hypothetical protein Tco_0675370 [Tanacetum coccineum]
MASSYLGCDAALETLPADMEAGEKAALMKKAYSTLILCLEDRVLQEVAKETAAARIWTKLTSLYMTKSLANRLYLKKKLYTYYMSPGTLLLTTFASFMKIYGGPLLYERILDNWRMSGDSEFTGDHLKRDCLKKKSSGFVKKGKRDQDSDSSDDDGNAYFGEALMVVRNDEMTELEFMEYRMKNVFGLRWNCRELKAHEAEVFQVSNDDSAVAQRRLGDKKLEEKTNMDCLVKGAEGTP